MSQLTTSQHLRPYDSILWFLNQIFTHRGDANICRRLRRRLLSYMRSVDASFIFDDRQGGWVWELVESLLRGLKREGYKTDFCEWSVQGFTWGGDGWDYQTAKGGMRLNNSSIALDRNTDFYKLLDSFNTGKPVYHRYMDPDNLQNFTRDTTSLLREIGNQFYFVSQDGYGMRLPTNPFILKGRCFRVQTASLRYCPVGEDFSHVYTLSFLAGSTSQAPRFEVFDDHCRYESRKINFRDDHYFSSMFSSDYEWVVDVMIAHVILC